MKSPLLGLLLLALVIPAVWFGIWPLWQKISIERAQAAELEQIVEAEKAANAKLIELAGQIASRQQDVETLEKSVSVNKDDATLIAVYEEAASNNGLVLTSIDFVDDAQPASLTEGEVATVSGLQITSSRITLEGSYTSIYSFLSDIEHSFPLVDIGEITFEPLDEEETGDPEFTIEVLLTSYYLK